MLKPTAVKIEGAARARATPHASWTRRSALVLVAAAYDDDSRGGYSRGRSSGGGRPDYGDNQRYGGGGRSSDRGGRRGGDFDVGTYDDSQGQGQSQQRQGSRGGYNRGEGAQQERGPRQGGQRYGRGGVPGGEGRPVRSLSSEAMQLNTTIQGASSWRELQRILESSAGGGAELDPFQLVGMLGKTAQVPAPTNNDDLADYQGFVAAVYGWLLSKVDQARPVQISRALSSVARLGLYNAELVGALVGKAERELHNFPDDDLIMLVEAMASLGVAPGETFAEQLLRRTQSRLPAMQGRSLAVLINTLSRIGVAPTPEWMASYATASLANIRGFNAQEFSSLVVGLATAGWRPSGPAQLQPLVDRCFPLLQYELRVERDAGRAGTASQSQDQQQQQSQQQPPRYGQRRFDNRPRSVEPQVAVDWLVNVSWALAQMVAGTGAQMPQQWTTAVFDKLQYVRRSMRPAELSSLVSSCAYLGARPSDATLVSLLRDLQNMYVDASGDDLANFAMAMAQFQYRPADRFLDDFLITLRRKLPTTSAAGLSTVAAALPSLSSGVRLNEVVADAQARYDAFIAQQQQQDAAYAAQYEQTQQPDEYQQQQDPAAAVAA